MQATFHNYKFLDQLKTAILPKQTYQKILSFTYIAKKIVSLTDIQGMKVRQPRCRLIQNIFYKYLLSVVRARYIILQSCFSQL